MYFANKLSYSKYCPFKKELGTCNGSQCAMWRWKPVLNPEWKPKSVSEFSPPTDYRKDPPPYIDSDKEGYCGLANRPSFNV